MVELLAEREERQAAIEAEKSPAVRPSRLRRWASALGHGIAWLWRGAVGLATIVLALAVLSTIPILQFLVLGYFLEAAGRVGRGQWRQALPGVATAARIGSALLAMWLLLLPGRFLGDLAESANLIAAGSGKAMLMQRLTSLAFAIAAFQIVVAIWRGGHFWWFFRPISNLRWLIARRRAANERGVVSRMASAVARLRPLHYFSLGAIGFLTAALWLAVPSMLLAAGRSSAGLGFLGGALLMVVVGYLPFLQARFAAEQRWRAMFDVGAVRESFRRASLTWFVTFAATLALAIPLYLFKIEPVPKYLTWVLALVFILTILPLKMLAGFAYWRAERRPRRAWLITRWFYTVLMVPIAALYAYIVYLVQYTGWNGALALYEHHAFLLPVPMPGF